MLSWVRSVLAKDESLKPTPRAPYIKRAAEIAVNTSALLFLRNMNAIRSAAKTGTAGMSHQYGRRLYDNR